MKTHRQTKKKKAVDVCNTQSIFSRVLHLNSTDKFRINNLFSYELGPILTTLFKDTDEGDIPHQKLI